MVSDYGWSSINHRYEPIPRLRLVLAVGDPSDNLVVEECGECYALVTDYLSHRDWHERQNEE